MSGHLQPRLVRFVDRRRQFLGADRRVRLQPGRPFGRPVPHEAPRLVGVLEARHDVDAFVAGHVRRGNVYARSGLQASLNLVLQVDLGVGRQASGRADRGHARRQVEALARVAHRMHPTTGRHVEEVVVQADHARHDRVARQLHDCGALRDGDRIGCTHRRDPIALQNDGLVAPNGSPSAVHQRHILESHDGRVNGHVGRGLGPASRTLCGERHRQAGSAQQARDREPPRRYGTDTRSAHQLFSL